LHFPARNTNLCLPELSEEQRPKAGNPNVTCPGETPLVKIGVFSRGLATSFPQELMHPLQYEGLYSRACIAPHSTATGKKWTASHYNLEETRKGLTD
jgi:hypothetical protein